MLDLIFKNGSRTQELELPTFFQAHTPQTSKEIS